MKAAVLYFLQRLQEPSSQAGLALLSQLPKAIWPAHAAVFDGVSALFCGLAIFLKEGKPPA